MQKKRGRESVNSYIKGKGVLVGIFNKEALDLGVDKKAVKEAEQKTGYKYTNTELVKKKRKIIGIKVYICTADDFSV